MPTIKIKNSQTATNVPSSLVQGELAINEQDELLFYRDGAGTVQSFDLTTTGGGSSGSGIVEGTKQATTSGTEFDFTSIPSGVKRITVNLNDVSLTGNDRLLVQIGDSGGIETTGYTSSAVAVDATPFPVNSTSGFIVGTGNGAGLASGHLVLTRIDGTSNTWIASHTGETITGVVSVGGGNKTLSGELTQIRLTRSGTDTFDGGSVNITYEDGTGSSGGTPVTITPNTFSGTGAQTTFTLSSTPASENDTFVYIDGVYQAKGTYSLSGADVVFTTAPPSGTNNVEVMVVELAAGGSGTKVFLGEATASNDTSIDFVDGVNGIVFDTTYDLYELELVNVIPATDNAGINLLTTSDSGTTFDTGATDYRWCRQGLKSNAASTDNSSDGDSRIGLLGGISNVSSESGLSGTVRFYNPGAVGICHIAGELQCTDSVGRINYSAGAGIRDDNTSNIDGFRFIPTSGNISSGTFKLYGIT